LAARLAGRSDVEIQTVSCLGRCDAAPAASLQDEPLAPLTLADLDRVVQRIDGNPASTLGPDGARRWKCDPYASPSEHYGAVRSLAATAGRTVEHRLEALKQSVLRGMGGAGFPTGRKWEMVAAETRQPKFVVCNADESEPGTFKDREILRQLPHLVIEGMLLAGLTVGAEHGIIYLRHEYGPEFDVLRTALHRARDEGVLGSDAAGTGRAFDIEIFVSPGGYILGEETALLEALEDRRGEPRNKPPYPGQHGLRGQPTLINNVETLVLAVSVLRNGLQWWEDQGEPGFRGLKFVSLSGDVEQPGVYEIPVGTTVRQLIEIAGGMRHGQNLKAFLPGGTSSNFLPAGFADTPIDFEQMQKTGSMLGSAGMIVFGEERNLFELALNMVEFFHRESCGKCVPCRCGSAKAVQLLTAVQAGQLDGEQLEWLPHLDETLKQTSICGLGYVVLNPVISMMQHFTEEIPGHGRTGSVP
jgi:NADH:ubiquinone oxidoreductase subunit F (NADH-binding)